MRPLWIAGLAALIGTGGAAHLDPAQARPGALGARGRAAATAGADRRRRLRGCLRPRPRNRRRHAARSAVARTRAFVCRESHARYRAGRCEGVLSSLRRRGAGLAVYRRDAARGRRHADRCRALAHREERARHRAAGAAKSRAAARQCSRRRPPAGCAGRRPHDPACRRGDVAGRHGARAGDSSGDPRLSATTRSKCPRSSSIASRSAIGISRSSSMPADTPRPAIGGICRSTAAASGGRPRPGSST